MAKPKTPLTISQAADEYLAAVKGNRSHKTFTSYRSALAAFKRSLAKTLPASKTPVGSLTEEHVVAFAKTLGVKAQSTEKTYLTVIKDFYRYLSGRGLMILNEDRLNLLLRPNVRRTPHRIPDYPHQQMDIVIDYALNLRKHRRPEGDQELLIALRDRALLITLADTGLRVSEITSLKRGDIDFNEARAVIIGKGNKQAVVRFSSRSLDVIRDYLRARGKQDGKHGVPLDTLPVFTRHDQRGMSRPLAGISAHTGWAIVKRVVIEALGEEGRDIKITPHSFRHYFVTKVLKETDNLRIAQLLARHSSIATTQRYVHVQSTELDTAFDSVFDNGGKPPKRRKA